MSELFPSLPPIRAELEASVIVPARDESAHIEASLVALCAQATLLGGPAAARRYETIVFANDCRDDTAARARAFAASVPEHVIHVVEGSVSASGNVGLVRRLAMDEAARRFLAAGKPAAWVVSTDADCSVAPDWLAETFAETAAEAVFGRVFVPLAEQGAFRPSAARSYLWDAAYRRTIASLEAALDPLAHDPGPRHGDTSSASLAVSARTYLAAGGMPPLACGEDAAFRAALERLDARVRHSPRVRVATSARQEGRVTGGFSRLMRMVGETDGPQQWLVEHPLATLRRIRARRALRGIWREGSPLTSLGAVLGLYDIGPLRFKRLYEPASSFGSNAQRFEADAQQRGLYAGYPAVPVINAVRTLRAALAKARRSTNPAGATSGRGSSGIGGTGIELSTACTIATISTSLNF